MKALTETTVDGPRRRIKQTLYNIYSYIKMHRLSIIGGWVEGGHQTLREAQKRYGESLVDGPRELGFEEVKKVIPILT